ncbi:MAG: hypothetical protein IIZ78_05585 [Clostridiales bacterium]|nr:hypothetical protein [Clostridiales bacterium]
MPAKGYIKKGQRELLTKKGEIRKRKIKIPKKISDIESKFDLRIENIATRNYSVKKDYQKIGLRLLSPKNADDVARTYLEGALKKYTPNKILPGQLIMFNYFEPKTKDQLEYYDAKPMTIFFCVFNSSQGKRILGFNLHYYPPNMRANVLDKIFIMYREMYVKYFDSNIPQEISAFDYKSLMNALKKYKLDFGVREYIPALCHNVRQVAPKYWKIALYTEGYFKKRTREQILNFWKKFKSRF